jgi:Concanavalin A-like lectin/glucanases superfamily
MKTKTLAWLFIIMIMALLPVGYFIYVQDLLDLLPGFSELIAGNSGTELSSSEAELLIPSPGDWVDYGHILENGIEGEWDFQWADATPGSIIKKDGTYYFYYIAADGFTSIEGEPRHRAIGVATSPDGIHYTKYPGNPIITHSPFNGEEEGANSAAVTLDESGNIVMYFGGAAGPRESITSDGRLAISEDGFNFTEIGGRILDHRNPFLYGFGDEIFPKAAFQHQGAWYVYYLPNGGINERTLGMAWGKRPDWLFRSIGVLDDGGINEPIGIWGNVIWLTPDQIALFIQRLWWPDTFVEVRMASPEAPYRLSEPVVRYDIPNLRRGTVYLDTERRTWFMIYNDFDRFWDLKLAPAGNLDTTPPMQPANPNARPLDHSSVELSWRAAADPDTGVVIYHIYQDNARIGSTKDLSFVASGLTELTSYAYEVSAVNFHGVEGPRARVNATTLADTSAPTLISASTQGNSTQLVLTFNELINPSYAEVIENYTIRPHIQVMSATLEQDGQTVKLVTSSHSAAVTYNVLVSNIWDIAFTPNKIVSESTVSYRHSPIEGLVGYWSLDDRVGLTARDFSGYSNHGNISGAQWQAGFTVSALRFDGIDDYVYIEDQPPLTSLTEDSFTFSAWVQPEDQPTEENPYAIFQRVNGHPAYSFGISYIDESRYQAQVISSDETFSRLRSQPIEPGGWHHVAMVVDEDAQLLHLYIDGEAVDGSPISYPGELLDLRTEMSEKIYSGEYYIGSTKPDRGAGTFHVQHFKGLINQVQIYSQALDAEAIRFLAARNK